MKRLAILAALALAACGSTTALKRTADTPAPPAPFGAATPPSDAALLTPTTQQRPARSVELLTSSHPRNGDDFDLPPN